MQSRVGTTKTFNLIKSSLFLQCSFLHYPTLPPSLLLTHSFQFCIPFLMLNTVGLTIDVTLYAPRPCTVINAVKVVGSLFQCVSKTAQSSLRYTVLCSLVAIVTCATKTRNKLKKMIMHAVETTRKEPHHK